MFSLLIILFRDLKLLTKTKYFYLKRSVFVFLAFVFVFGSIGFYSGSDCGKKITVLTSYTLFFTILFYAPVFSTQAILLEIKSKTLELIVMAKISYKNILLGKYIQCFFSIFLSTFSTLPVFLFCSIIGGISNSQIIYIFLLLSSLLILAIAVGIFSSIFFSSKHASNYAVLLMIFFIGLEYMITGKFVLESILDGVNVTDYYFTFGWQIMLSCSLLILATKRLPYLHSLYLGNSISKKHNKKRVIGKNPVAWRDRSFLHSKPKWILILVYLTLTFFIAPFVSNKNLDRYWSFSNSWFYYNVRFLYKVFIINIFISASLLLIFTLAKTTKSFHQPKENWEMLLLTTLSDKEIAVGKMLSIYHSLFPYIIYLILSCLMTCCSLFLLKDRELISFVMYLFSKIAFFFAISCCALYFSLICQTRRTTSYYLFFAYCSWELISAMVSTPFMIPHRGFRSMLLMWSSSTMIHVLIGVWFLGYIIENLRRHLLKRNLFKL